MKEVIMIKKYQLRFRGREIDSEGPKNWFKLELEAFSEEDALIQINKTHKHVSNISCKEITEIKY